MTGRRPVVAMVSDAIYPYNAGGKEIRYHELTRRLARRADVHVYTMRWWPGPRTRTEDSVSFHAISPLIPLYSSGRRSLKQAGGFALATLRMLTRRFDVLEADHIPYLQIVALRAVASLRRKPFVVTWHEVWGLAAWQEYLGKPLGRAAWFTEWLAMRLPDRIIAASPQTADRLKDILGSRAAVTVAPNGIDLDAIRGVPPDPVATDLVVVGRLLSHKRVDMLLDAVALLHAGGTPVTCRIIGTGPEAESLHSHAEALGIGNAVEFRHDVAEQKDLYALVKSARVFVAPSAREGFGIAVLEALACGVPVVTTSAPDNLAQHLAARSPGSVVCDPAAAAIAAAVTRMLAQDTVRPGSGSAGLTSTWLSGYTWDAVTDLVAGALGI
jgi:glycosyltransferase involved in cell wall biosynthesis